MGVGLLILSTNYLTLPAIPGTGSIVLASITPGINQLFRLLILSASSTHFGHTPVPSPFEVMRVPELSCPPRFSPHNAHGNQKKPPQAAHIQLRTRGRRGSRLLILSPKRLLINFLIAIATGRVNRKNATAPILQSSIWVRIKKGEQRAPPSPTTSS